VDFLLHLVHIFLHPVVPFHVTAPISFHMPIVSLLFAFFCKVFILPREERIVRSQVCSQVHAFRRNYNEPAHDSSSASAQIRVYFRVYYNITNKTLTWFSSSSSSSSS
jgi:hypothetical protein